MAWTKKTPDMDHYDVAVLGVWFGANYGSLLNGYSVYRILKDMGKSVLMVQKINAIPNDGEINGTHNAHFMESFYPPESISPVYKSSQLAQLNAYCDTFLTGSDQIWEYNINKYFDMAFWLGFVDESKRKISFGTSFGHVQDRTPKKRRSEGRRLFARFQALSVREESGVDLCRDVYGVKARTVIEPVFCVDRTVFDELAASSAIAQEQPYLLTYILDPTPEKRALIEAYCTLTGKKAINILDGQPNTYERNVRALDLPNCMPGIGAEDFLKLYQEAEFVITDSFHGTAFSLIYEKPFLAVANSKRGYSRFEDLLGRFGLMDRLVYDRDLPGFSASERFLASPDYARVRRLVAEAREDSLGWLAQALEAPVTKESSVAYPDVTKVLDMEMCMGCGACVCSCPTNALSLQPDELGFYRSTINYDVCIECKACTRVCPALHLPQVENSTEPSCHEYVNADPDVLRKSSSGGVFTTMARQVLAQGGVVIGAAWQRDLSVAHIAIESEADLHKLQKSKYLQSYSGTILKDLRSYLEAGRVVLFTGTPCQVAGLRNYLGKDYDNLLVADLLCGNAPSTMFFKKYLNESFGKHVKGYEFRYKDDTHGWSASHVKVSLPLGRSFVRSGERQDNFQRVYHNHSMCAVHCEKCRYQSLPRLGDVTIGDFWWIEKHEPALETRDGVSLVLCNNEKGSTFFASLPESAARVNKEAPLEWMGGNGHSLVGGKNWCGPGRDAFFEAIQTKGFREAVDYALKPNHGQYRPQYAHTDSPLRLDSALTRFRFETDVWEEATIGGRPTLLVQDGKWQLGHYARLPLACPLEKGLPYRLSARFRIKSRANVLNLHVIDSGSRILQLVHSEKIGGRANGEQWIAVDVEFTPDADFYDEFMIGAAQVSGPGNFISFDYVSITKA